MTGEPTHSASEMALHAPAPYHLKSELSIMLNCQLQYFQPIEGPEPRDFEWSGHPWTAMKVIVMHTTQFLLIQYDLLIRDYLLWCVT